MGLDMYLHKKLHFYGDRKCTSIKISGITGINASDISEISIQIMDWRKCNQIHKWFVDNVQNGNDDCGSYYVRQTQLKELLSTIKKVLKNKKLAKELLPTQSGFFYGDTEYDEYYWKDLELTKEKLIVELITNKVKGQNDLYEYEYSSSW